jgi:cytochrome c2
MDRPRRTRAAVALATLAGLAIGPGESLAGDAVAGKAIFERICHACHAALPYTGRVGVANLPLFLANPRKYNPKTAMTFPGLRQRKDIDDVIAFITGDR